MVRYILVTGGVISGIGKGIIASSTGLLLKALGLRVTAIKIDPYLNIDAGTMNPVEHGPCCRLGLAVAHPPCHAPLLTWTRASFQTPPRRGVCAGRRRRGRPRPGKL